MTEEPIANATPGIWHRSMIGLLLASVILIGDHSGSVAAQTHDAVRVPLINTQFAGAQGTTGNLVADPAIAAGPDRLVLISNAEVVIYSLAGTQIARVGLHAFFLPGLVASESSAGDVDAIFDAQSQRFFLSEAAKIQPQTCDPGTCVGHNMIAVSKTATPASLGTDDWYFYAIDRYLDRVSGGETFTTNWGDFDHLGTDDNALVITSRQYRESDGVQVGSKIRILDKSELISGQTPATWVDILSPGDFAGIMPAMTFGTAPALFMVSRSYSGGCGITVWGLGTGTASPTVIKRQAPLDGDCASPSHGPQPSGAPALDIAGIGLATTPVYRDGSLWIADTWRQDFGSGFVAVINWAELDVSGWPDSIVVVQQGMIGTDQTWSFFPSLTVDRNGSLTIAFYTTSTQEFPSLKVAARLASDPAGTMRPPRLVRGGETAVISLDGAGRNRFADYSDMALDASGSASWIHGQFGTTGTWRTWVARTSVSPFQLWTGACPACGPAREKSDVSAGLVSGHPRLLRPGPW